MAPVVVVLDAEIQKQEAGDLQVPKYQPPEIEGVGAADADRIAAGLVAANNPRINVGRLRTPEGIDRAVELAGSVPGVTEVTSRIAVLEKTPTMKAAEEDTGT